MGLFFSTTKSKESTEIIEMPITRPKYTLKEIIEQYEYIKKTKCITNIDIILEIVENTNWDTEYMAPTPSAPPLEI